MEINDVFQIQYFFHLRMKSVQYYQRFISENTSLIAQISASYLNALTESENDRMIKVGMNPWRLSGPNPLLKQATQIREHMTLSRNLLKTSKEETP